MPVPKSGRVRPAGYNEETVRRRLWLSILPALALFLSGIPSRLWGQERHVSETVLVLPFDNVSHAPGLDWIGESFPEVLSGGMTTPALFAVGREERLYAFERLGIPIAIRPSRATIYRIAEEMDVDYVVLGRYDYDGKVFTASAQILNLKTLRLSPELSESGALASLLELENGLAWDLLRTLDPGLILSRNQFIARAPQVRLDSFENYIRALTTVDRAERIRRLRAAVHLSPSYSPALLLLGKTLYQVRDQATALSWLTRIPPDDPLALEANFYIGLSAFYSGDYARAESAFEFLAARLPLTEVYNNLGVAASRRGKKTAVDDFRKAVQADPQDADYRFNLAVGLLRNQDAAGATTQLREAVALRTSDSEARSLLMSVVNQNLPPSLPLERLKVNYDEAAFRRLALEIDALKEQSLEHADAATHVHYHVTRGNEMLYQGFATQAEREYREALRIGPLEAEAHAAMARYLEYNHDSAGARSEARTALKLKPSAEAYCVLGRLDLLENNMNAARENANRALALEPGNLAARALGDQITARLAQKAPALPKP